MVKANSMVLDNVPDYCVVSGNPAAVVHIYDTSSCDWVEVSDNEQAQALLMARSHHPCYLSAFPLLIVHLIWMYVYSRFSHKSEITN